MRAGVTGETSGPGQPARGRQGKDIGGRQPLEQLFHGEAKHGVAGVGRELGQWLEYEAPAVHFGVRNLEVGFDENVLSPEEDVQVYGARALQPLGGTSKFLLHVL